MYYVLATGSISEFIYRCKKMLLCCSCQWSVRWWFWLFSLGFSASFGIW